MTEQPLPEGWTECMLGDVLRQAFRKARVQSDQKYARLGVRWYAAGPFRKDAVPGGEIKGQTLFEVRGGDFIYNRLFAWKGSFGVVGPDLDGCFVSNEFPVFQVDPKLAEPEFLWRWFSQPHVWTLIEDRSSGSTSTSRLRFKEDDLLRIPVPLPPIEEQRSIVSALRAVNNAKEAAMRTVQALRELKRSLTRHLFTFGAAPFSRVDQVSLKDTSFGCVPEHWEVKPLGALARVGNGSTPKRDNPSYWTNGTIPWLTSGKVHEGVIRAADQFVTETARSECHLPLVKSGSIVVAITGQGKTLGNAAMVTFDTAVSQHLAYVQPTSDCLLSEFMLYFLQGRYEHFRQVSQAAGSTKGALTCGFLKSYELPIPPKSEQEAIVTALTAMTDRLKETEARAHAVQAVFQSLLHGLLSGKVRVSDLPVPGEG